MSRPASLLFALSVLLAVIPTAGAAQAPVQLSDSRGTTYLYPGSSLAVLTDSARTMSIHDVAASGSFVPMHSTPDDNAAYWIRLTYSTANTTRAWQLFLGYKAETADLYVPDGHGGYTISHSGISVPYADRPVKVYGAILFDLPNAPASKTVYVRITTREPELTIAIDSKDTEENVSKVQLAIIIGLDAILVSLIISSMVFYLTSRDKTYLYYLFYVVAELLYRTDDQGLAAAVFWPHWAMSSLRIGSLFDAIRIVAAMVFLRAFLNLPGVSKWLDRINIGFACGFFLLGLLEFAGAPFVRASWLSELSLVYVPLWLVSSIVAWRRGVKQGRLIAIGWSLLMLFSFSFGLKQLGFARGNLFVELVISQGRNFGVALQTLFLSLAISTDITRLMRSRQYYESLAATDPLTGLSNRRAFEETFRREWNRAVRARKPLSLLLLDVDFFKDYNDRNGHAAGDLALRHVADRSVAVMRHAGDLLCRYGGDEFVVILPDADGDAAKLVAERLHTSVSERRLPNAGSPFGIVTVSVGVATVRPEEGHDPQDLFELADRALYNAKELGRDRCAAIEEPSCV